MCLGTHRTRKVMCRRTVDQGLDDDLPLLLICGLSNLSQERESGGSVRSRVSEYNWEQGHKLTRGIVAVRLVLSECQTQEQLSAFLEAIGMKGNLVQSPDEVPTNIAPDHVQIRNVPKGAPNPVCHQEDVNLGQCRENFRVLRLHDAVYFVERPPAAAKLFDDPLRDIGRIKESKLLCCPHLELGTGVTSQNVFPLSGTPIAPLAFGQPQSDRTRLQGHRPTAASSHPPVDEPVETAEEIVGTKVLAPRSNLVEVVTVGMIHSH